MQKPTEEFVSSLRNKSLKMTIRNYIKIFSTIWLRNFQLLTEIEDLGISMMYQMSKLSLLKKHFYLD